MSRGRGEDGREAGKAAMPGAEESARLARSHSGDSFRKISKHSSGSLQVRARSQGAQ